MSLFFQFRDRGLLRKAYVTVESLRNSVSSICQYLGQCIVLHLKCKDPRKSLPARLCGWRFLLTMKSRTCSPMTSNFSSPGVCSKFLRHARTEWTLWGSSWTRSRQLGGSQSCRAVVWSRSVPLRRPWWWPRFAALRTSCRSFAPETGRAFFIWVQGFWSRQKSSWCRPPLCAG